MAVAGEVTGVCPAQVVDGKTYELRPGGCLRYQLFGPSLFVTPDRHGARYTLFIV